MIKRLLRWLGIHVHDWGRWRDNGELFVNTEKGQPIALRVVGLQQMRICSLCGRRETRRIWFL